MAITFNSLLQDLGIDEKSVLVLRHRPIEPQLRKALPWFAEDMPGVFNAYQQTQGQRVEGVMKALSGSGYVASFIGNAPGEATWVGLYKIGKYRRLKRSQYWELKHYNFLKEYGIVGPRRRSLLQFQLAATGHLKIWKGKLVVKWPGQERSWWRRCHRNSFDVLAIHTSSIFAQAMPNWDELCLSWQELKSIPQAWRQRLQEWRGIYYIYDVSTRMGYVGSAYGEQNIWGRWCNYAATGHGGNRHLRTCKAQNFKFSILQRVSPDMNAEEIVGLEQTWKARLHTQHPKGLNEN